MNCKTCANYKPIEVRRPDDHPGRIFAEDLRAGMVIRRHGTPGVHKLVVILGKPEKFVVASLLLKAGSPPCECLLRLATSGLQPYVNGSWHSATWCEEVT